MLEDIRNCFTKVKYKLFEDRRIALVKLEGIIIDAGNIPVATKLIEAIESVKKHDIKAMVLRINSPGGTVGASQEIYDAVKRLRDKENIKVVVSLGDVAASGGVYVAAAGDKIVSNPGTVTGSIGVIIRTAVIKDLYKKIGIDHQVIKSGPYKDILSNIRYLSDEEKEILQQLIDNTYNQFVETVAKSRNLDIEKVKEYADGRIFTGLQAKEYGLVDEIGSQQDAVDLAAKLAGIKGQPLVVDMTPKKNFLQKITGATLNELFENMGLSSTYSGVPLWLMPGI
jgi:protease-4